MKTFAPLALLCALVATAPAQADPRLNVVELFQSQGCSSCPPANANVIALSEREDVLALSFGVTYWDYLGWRDTFAKPAFTQRQRDYARGLGASNVYTPQVVVNGRADLTGHVRADLERAIRRNVRPPFEPTITVAARALTIGEVRGQNDVWLVWYDPRVVEVPIRRGENGGRTLPHRNVVRDVIHLGLCSGAQTRLKLPTPPDPSLRGAILVQQRDGGPIVAAARVT